MLELTIPYRQFESQFNNLIILPPPAELCRAAHWALCQIAKSRASTFITTIAREVARHTTAVVNPGAVQKLQSSTLVRAKDEVLRIIEMLTEKIPNAVSDLLGEVLIKLNIIKILINFILKLQVVDIVLFCVDSSALKRQRLSEAFPPFQRFHMLSFCNQTRKISGKINLIYFLKLIKNKSGHPDRSNHHLRPAHVKKSSRRGASRRRFGPVLLAKWQVPGDVLTSRESLVVLDHGFVHFRHGHVPCQMRQISWHRSHSGFN